MEPLGNPACNFVVKALDLPSLRFLDASCPAPHKIEWINRATDRRLRATTISQLTRTLQAPKVSPSVQKLRVDSGIRTFFTQESERNLFARCFEKARRFDADIRTHFVTANFRSIEAAKAATVQLIDCGIAAQDICLIRSSDALDLCKLDLPDGHGKFHLACNITFGGMLGMAIGLAAVCVPVAGIAGSLLAMHSLSVAPAVGGVLGITGSALTKMVSDLDVDGNALWYFQKQIQRGDILLSIDLRGSHLSRGGVEQLLLATGACLQKH